MTKTGTADLMKCASKTKNTPRAINIAQTSVGLGQNCFVSGNLSNNAKKKKKKKKINLFAYATKNIIFLTKTDRARVDEKRIEKTEKTIINLFAYATKNIIFLTKTDRAQVDEKKIQKTEKTSPNSTCCNSICLRQA